jgi:hypothetical protein
VRTRSSSSATVVSQKLQLTDYVIKQRHFSSNPSRLNSTHTIFDPSKEDLT